MKNIKFNADFIKIQSEVANKENNFIYLENIVTGEVIKLSIIEYDLLEQMIEKDIQIVSEQNEIYQNDLSLLLEQAKDLKLVVTNKEQVNLSPIKYVSDYIAYFFNLFAGVNLHFPLSGDIRFFSVAILNLGKVKLVGKFWFPYAYLIFSFFSFIWIILNVKEVFYYSPFGINDLFAQWSVQYFLNFVLLICISSLLHEIGHYVFYKHFGGKYKIFGLGVIYMLIPVFFIRVPEAQLGDNLFISNKKATHLGCFFAFWL